MDKYLLDGQAFPRALVPKPHRHVCVDCGGNGSKGSPRCRVCYLAKCRRSAPRLFWRDLGRKRSVSMKARLAWLTQLRRCARCGQEKLRLYWPRWGHAYASACRECTQRREWAATDKRLLKPRNRWPSVRAATEKGYVGDGVRERAAERAAVRERRAEERAARSRSVQEAFAAWGYWLRERASAEAVVRFYEATGKPWNNPRLSAGEKWAQRYRLDPVYRQKEIHRQGNRKKKLLAQSDGTVDMENLGKVYMERKACPYCGARLKFTNRVLDHMDPIALGGHHSAANLTVACRDCNDAKRSMSFAAWLQKLPTRYRAIARSLYERKRGAPLEQARLW